MKGKEILTLIEKNSPSIMTGLGVIGMISTVALAVKATPKAMKLMDEKKPQTKLETVKVCWKPYIPTAVMGSISMALLISANNVNMKRNSALVAAYTLAEKSMSNLKKAAVETIGDKKFEEVKSVFAKKQEAEAKNEEGKTIIVKDSGNTIFFDEISGRYFKENIQNVEKSINEFNKRLLDEMRLSLNEWYIEIGLTPTVIGDELYWDVNNEGLLEIEFIAHLHEETKEPCIYLSYGNMPK